MRADDTSTLSDGDVVVIGNASHGKLLSTTEEKNRRKATPATFGPDGCPEPSGDAQLITLARLSDGWRHRNCAPWPQATRTATPWPTLRLTR